MSRRSHVVRTDDQGPRGPSRSLGGCQIYCSYEDCGSVYQGDSIMIAPITITSTQDFQRVFVSATVGGVNASVPDPPPPDPWQNFSITFVPPDSDGTDTDQRWFSDGFDLGFLGGSMQIGTAHYRNLPGGSYAWELAHLGSYNDATERYDPFQTMPVGTGTLNMNSVTVSGSINFSVMMRGYDRQVDLICAAQTDASIEGTNWSITTGHMELQESPD